MEISQIIDFYMWSINSIINKSVVFPIIIILSIMLTAFSMMVFHDEEFKYNFLHQKTITCWLFSPVILMFVIPTFHLIVLISIGYMVAELINKLKKEWSI